MPMQPDFYEFRNELPLSTVKSWRESILSTASFEHIGWSGAPKEPYRHWAAYPEFSGVYKDIFNCLNESAKYEGLTLVPERVIVNCYNHGDSSWLHKDGDDDRHWTFLLFMNEYWDLNWGGDFVLIKDNEIYQAVAPTPGKFILFQGNILHAARPVSREAQFPRLGLAIQCLKDSKM